jgi:hypothetical protein
MKRVLISCDGAIVPSAVTAQDWQVKKALSHRDSKANLALKIQSPMDILLSSVEDHAADLVRIASYVYGADHAVRNYLKTRSRHQRRYQMRAHASCNSAR